MSYIQCKDREEFEKILNKLKKFEFIGRDLSREENPLFVSINEPELKIEFLMSPKELVDCKKEKEYMRDRFEFFAPIGWSEWRNESALNDFFSDFYSHFRQLVVKQESSVFSWSKKKGAEELVWELNCTDEDLEKPDIQEGLRHRETFKKMQETKQESLSQPLPNSPEGSSQIGFFSASVVASKEAIESQQSLSPSYINKFREPQ